MWQMWSIILWGACALFILFALMLLKLNEKLKRIKRWGKIRKLKRQIQFSKVLGPTHMGTWCRNCSRWWIYGLEFHYSQGRITDSLAALSLVAISYDCNDHGMGQYLSSKHMAHILVTAGIIKCWTLCLSLSMQCWSGRCISCRANTPFC